MGDIVEYVIFIQQNAVSVLPLGVIGVILTKAYFYTTEHCFCASFGCNRGDTVLGVMFIQQNTVSVLPLGVIGVKLYKVLFLYNRSLFL